MEEIKQIVEDIYEDVVRVRRHIHQHPELDFHEFETAAYICNYLDSLGICYEKNIAKTGVVGLIDTQSDKTLLIRADMDALPMQEEADVPFKSKNDGVMHACGHDAHVAMLLGCATVLWKIKERLSCNIKLLFQPAEEDAGGALPMIEAGVLENPRVDAAIGAHVNNAVPAGSVLIKDGEFMAAPDDFDLVIHGKGGHGALPHKCVDPIAIAVQILTAWNILSARYTTPLEKHVISTNCIQAGTTYNVIPDEAVIRGTVRTYDAELRRKLPVEMESIAHKIAEAFGATCDFTFTFRYPPLINDVKMAEAFRKSAANILGEDCVVPGKDPSMGGEDFAYFAERVPAVFVHVGTGNENEGITMPWHSSNFMIDESGMKAGVCAMCKFALDFGR